MCAIKHLDDIPYQINQLTPSKPYLPDPPVFEHAFLACIRCTCSGPTYGTCENNCDRLVDVLAGSGLKVRSCLVDKQDCLTRYVTGGQYYLWLYGENGMREGKGAD
jgi:hypothetical protein